MMASRFSPDEYDAWYETPLGSLCDRLEKETIFEVFKPKGFILDIGCGTGNYTIELYSLSPGERDVPAPEGFNRGVRVIGIDASFDMVSFAKNKIVSKGFKPLFVVANAEDMPFKSNIFDAALSVTALCFIKEPERVIKEAHMVLKPEGVFALGELNKFSYWTFLRRLKGLFKESVYKKARFFSIKTLTDMLNKTGFKDLQGSSCLYFPPINSSGFLKAYRFFENIGKAFFPKNGAFIVVSGRK